MRMLCLFTIAFLFCLLGAAQERYPYNQFSTKNYKAERQNWGVSQDKYGITYFANNEGLLEFDGNRWILNPTPNQTIMRSVATSGNRIYTGAYMDFGYWTRLPNLTLQYTSLVKTYNLKLLKDEQIWNIHDVGNYMVFQTLDRVYFFNKKESYFKIVDFKNGILNSFTVKNKLYIQEKNLLLYEIINGKKHIIPFESTTEKLVLIYEDSTKQLSALSATGKIFKITDKLKLAFNLKFNIVEDYEIYSAIKLNNGFVAIGTISRGLHIFSDQYQLNMSYNQKNGFQDNTVLSLYQDRFGNLWNGLDNGISVINYNSPFLQYTDINGVLGAVYAASLYNDILYIGTNQGLFYKSSFSKEPYKLIKGSSGQVWSLQIIDNTLFCGHNKGTFMVKSDKFLPLYNESGTWLIKRFQDKLLAGNYDGLAIFDKNENNEWFFRNKINGFELSSRFMAIEDSSTVWINHEYKGIFKIEIDKQLEDVKKSTEFDDWKFKNSALITHNSKILYRNKNGIYTVKNDSITKDTLLTKLIVKDIDSYSSGKLIANNSKLWFFDKQGMGYISNDILKNNQRNYFPIPSYLREAISGYEHVIEIEKNKLLLGTQNGYLLFNEEQYKKNTPQVDYRVTNISVKGKDNIYKSIELKNKIELSPDQKDIIVFYTIPNYEKFVNVQYRYKLVGYQDTWSRWTDNAEVSYKKIKSGDYTLLAEANLNGKIYDRKIEIIINTPWYLSTIAKIAYILLGILFFLSINASYKRYYKKQQNKLVVENKRKLKVQRIEKEKELIKLRNEKLNLDIESQNRELAASAMNIVRKNELLADVQKILDKIEYSDNQRVIAIKKLVKDNLGGSGDWDNFKEAFDRAEKGFLNNIKQLHPNLTPNDLKLCAYLRLNLSSKELAPLLNISYRSVEIKRYRLRKKMNLPHEQNLVDYILRI